MNEFWTVTIGNLVAPGVAVALGLIGAGVTYVVFRTTTKIFMKATDKRLDKADEETKLLVSNAAKQAAKELADAEAEIAKAIAEVNRRVSDFSDGALQTQKEIREHKEYSSKHYVETVELEKMRSSTQDMIGELRADVREAIGSMNDARDTVITIAARLYPDSPNPVPPRRVRGSSKSS